MHDSNDADGLFTAGQVVQPGRYQRVDVTGGRTVILDEPGFLPASLDGQVALYQRITPAAQLIRLHLANVAANSR